jgi:RNA polymerase sigma-70 factor (sigma-E family)
MVWTMACATAEATRGRRRRLWYVELKLTDGRLRDLPPPEALDGVTALYREHALGLIRLAVVMLGDRQAAEDVVQDAFTGLYRRWHALSDTSRALGYVRSSVLNGARSALRKRARQQAAPGDPTATAASPEAEALLSEEHREVLEAIRRLPDRQREALVLRFYLELSEQDIARSMGISRGTVKSTTSRALAALRRTLGDQP